MSNRGEQASQRIMRRSFCLSAAAAATALSTSVAATAAKQKAAFYKNLGPGHLGVRANQRQALDYAVRYGFDSITPGTREFQNTSDAEIRQWLQAMKAKRVRYGAGGLPVDFRPADTFRLFPPRHWIRRTRRALFGDYGLTGTYKRHPDPNQERFFFGLVRECMEKGVITEELLREEMAKNHVRHDAMELIKNAA